MRLPLGSVNRSCSRRSTSAFLAVLLALSFALPVPVAADPGDPWQTVGGRITSSPDLATLPGGSAYFVARGLDGAAWLHLLEPGDRIGQGSWSSLGGQILGGPAISATAAEDATQGEGRLDLFARGADDALWTRSFDAAVGIWTPWTSLGGILTSEPSAVAFGDPGDTTPPTSLRIAVFARGRDGGMWYRELVGTAGWGPWTSVGGILRSAPGAGGHPAVFLGSVAVRGADNAVWFLEYDGKTGEFSPWFSGGGITNAAPAAEFFCTPALWARGTDEAIWHQVLDPDTGWTSYGGIARSGPGTHMAISFPIWLAGVRGADDGLWLTADDIQFDEAHCGPAPAAGAGRTGGPAPAWLDGLR